MYRCEITGKLSRQGDPRTGELYHVGENKTDEDIRAPEKLNRIVIATRDRTYTRWVRNEETNKWEEVFVAKGTEIVKEINVCQEGLDLWNGWSPTQQLSWTKAAFPHLFKGN